MCKARRDVCMDQNVLDDRRARRTNEIWERIRRTDDERRLRKIENNAKKKNVTVHRYIKNKHYL